MFPLSLDDIQNRGLFIETPILLDREWSIPDSGQTGLTDEEIVTALRIDTESRANSIYQFPVIDSQSGMQCIRAVKVTRPYNQDWLASAHVCLFVLPVGGSRIITPAEGCPETWRLLLHASFSALSALLAVYAAEGHAAVGIVGINCSPHTTDDDFLQTQSVKAAHAHVLVLTDTAVRAYRPFDSKDQLRGILMGLGYDAEDARQDGRRFFSSAVLDAFGQAAGSYIKGRVPPALGPWSWSTLANHRDNRFPLLGLQLSAESFGAVATANTVQMMRWLYCGLTSFYSDILMACFSANYAEAIRSPTPHPGALEFRNPDHIEARAYECLSTLHALSPVQITRVMRVVRFLGHRMSSDKKPAFALGPASSFTWIVRPGRPIDMLFSFSPFGGGSMEAIGLNKLPPTAASRIGELFEQYRSPESRRAEARALAAVISGAACLLSPSSQAHDTVSMDADDGLR